MEQVAGAVDPETIRKLKGFRCHLKTCQQFLPGYVAELKLHFQLVHGMNTSNPNQLPFVCSECGCIYSRFKTLKRHIITSHPQTEEEPLRAEAGSPDPNLDLEQLPYPSNLMSDYSAIRNPAFFKPPVTAQELRDTATEFVTKMRCDVSVPETKIQDFMEAASQLHGQLEVYSIGIFKEFLQAKAIPLDDIHAVEAINKLAVNSLFADVRTPQDSLAHLSNVANYAIPMPKEVELGKTKVINVTKIPPKIGANRRLPAKTIKKTKVVKHVAHYVSIKDTLALIVQNSDAREMLENEQVGGVLRGFKDGSRFQQHPFLSRHPNAIRISLHLDDVEHNNPLGSRKGVKKMTVFSFKIENFNSVVNADLSRIYLTLTVCAKDLKKYGYDLVMRPLIEDLQRLESDNGVNIKVGNGEDFTLRAVLVHVIGDTLAVHDIFRLMGPQAKIFCRICYITREALHRGCPEGSFPWRTPDSVKSDLEAIEDKSKQPSDLGIIGNCALHHLKYFNIATNSTMDPMHDLLEGVVPKVLKLLFHDFVNNKKLISVDEINAIIVNFNYGTAETRDKPSPNFSLKSLKSPGYTLSQSASQTWTLLRAFPFMFKKILFTNTNYLSLIGSLLKIVYFAFSNKLTLSHISELEQEITNFHRLFRICFPYVRFINKMHHLVHYPSIIRNEGPVVNFSCMLFEGKFKESKRQSKTCNNFVNLSLSLAKRFNLRQVHAILHHSYETDKVTIISSVSIEKVSSDYAIMLFDFPNTVTLVRHMKINGTSFRPDLIVRYKMCEETFYGEIKQIIFSEDTASCIIEELKCEAFYEEYNSYKVLHTGKIVRISPENLCTRKTYSLWQFHDDDGFYISLKYNDE